ncbi:hypothetical protein BS50DRAFT_666692 [Corynespora cassiicola Philippines]|uniref:PWWP domain-containing protein n=1 Tax=Corynespora cassiicola Philippines TaxID=1448308 RepID=A0A2T2NMP7_CORCC|nr:hypothetical protein BS50DRAFT_666692 [Corynespora cassiicola Philippines]
MIGAAPGCFVLYQKDPSTGLPWPAVICPDDFAPKDLRKNRPIRFNTLILIMGARLRFEYAEPGEIIEYTPFFDEEKTLNDPAYAEALAMTDSALEAQLDLDHWRIETEGQRTQQLNSPTPSEAEFIDYPDHDFQTKETEMTQYAGTKRNMWLPTPSPTQSPKKPRKTKQKRAERGLVDIRTHLPPAGHQSPTPNISVNDKNIGRLSRNFVEDLGDSKEFVEFVVGKEKKVFHILKEAIDRRPYFVGNNTNLRRPGLPNTHGFDFLQPKGTKGWKFVKPALKNMKAGQFKLVAEYLEGGDFGLREVENEEQRSTVLLQCADAWDAGEQLGMDDLLEHVAIKIALAAPLAEDEVLQLSRHIYKTPGAPLPAYKDMKTTLSTFIADNLSQYVRNDSGKFTKMMRKLPELHEDVVGILLERTQEVEEDGTEEGSTEESSAEEGSAEEDSTEEDSTEEDSTEEDSTEADETEEDNTVEDDTGDGEISDED